MEVPHVGLPRAWRSFWDPPPCYRRLREAIHILRSHLKWYEVLTFFFFWEWNIPVKFPYFLLLSPESIHEAALSMGCHLSTSRSIHKYLLSACNVTLGCAPTWASWKNIDVYFRLIKCYLNYRQASSSTGYEGLCLVTNFSSLSVHWLKEHHLYRVQKQGDG